MSNEKPVEDTSQKPDGAGAPAAEGKENQPADHQSNLLESLSEDHRGYLKGIGIEEFNSESLQKLVDSAQKQKQSVSQKSLELEQLKAQLQSQGKSVEVPEETPAPIQTQAPETQAPVATPEPSTPVRGVTENDLFDLSMTINRDFPELRDEAADGRLFAELRQFGYFGVEGINKKQVYEHLTRKHAQAKELAELRAFKEKYSQPDPSLNPTYNPGSTISGKQEKTPDWARQVVAASINGQNVDEKTLIEARSILQKQI